MSEQPLYIPANQFWSRVFNAPLNRPISQVDLARINEIEMVGNITRVHFSEDRKVGTVNNREVDDIPWIEEMTSVKKLTITYNSVACDYAQNHRLLCLLSRLPGVERLHIRCAAPSGDIPLAYLHRMQRMYQPMFARLKSLSIEADVFEDDWGSQFSLAILSQPMPRLEQLNLSKPMDWSNFSVLQFPALKRLYARKLKNVPSINQLLDRLPNLEELHLMDFSPSETQQSDAPVKAHPSLRKLAISGGMLDQVDAQGLESLCLKNVYFDPTPLAGMQSLRELILEDCALDQPVPALCALHNLERLELRGCGLKNLDLIRGLSRLKALNLEQSLPPIHKEEEGYPPELTALETLTGLLSLTVDYAVGEALLCSKPVIQRFKDGGMDWKTRQREGLRVLLRR